MRKSYIGEKLSEFKEKFMRFFGHRKKVQALENLSLVADFRHTKYLFLIKHCLDDGFLEKPEETFLDHMIAKYEINYLDWCHKTRWLRGKMLEMSKAALAPDPMFVDFDTRLDQRRSAVPPVQLPLPISAMHKIMQGKRV